jgi:Na+/proline symporter
MLETIIVILICLVFGFSGYWFSRGKVTTLQEYIVARNSIGAPLSTATFVATGMGAWILFAPVETTINFGLIALIGYAVGGASPLIAFWFLGPRLRLIMPNGNTLAEYIGKRFGGLAGVIILIVMVFYMFVFLSAELTAIGQTIRIVAPNIHILMVVSIIGLVTTAYTSYGGLRASILTDGIQFLIICPLILVLFVATIYSLGNPMEIVNNVNLYAGDKLDLRNQSGIATGVALIVAVLSANLFHQGYWQRIFSARNDRDLKMSLGISSVLVMPIIMIAGSFGIMALSVSETFTGVPSVAMFDLIQKQLPGIVGILVIILAIALVMSSMDTLLNGIVSLAIPAFSVVKNNNTVLYLSRMLTVGVVLPAIFIASREFSVLYMFFIADLVAAAFIVPVFTGMYSKYTKGWMVVVAGLSGIVGSLTFFPKSDWSGVVFDVLRLGKDPSLMNSFLSSLIIAGILVIILGKIDRFIFKTMPYDFDILSK